MEETFVFQLVLKMKLMIFYQAILLLSVSLRRTLLRPVKFISILPVSFPLELSLFMFFATSNNNKSSINNDCSNLIPNHIGTPTGDRGLSMRNIFLFIRRYFAFLLFIFLQLIALWMLFKFNRVHKVIGLGIASEFTGTINKQVDKLDDYVHQGQENARVHRMNDSLLNILPSNFYFPDTSQQLVIDSVAINDTTKGVRRYLVRDAKVVYSTINAEKNYLQIDRGSKYGIKDNMAVLNSDGAVVGQVVNVSPNFSAVMSLLHIQNSVSAALKNLVREAVLNGMQKIRVLFY